MKAGPRTPKPVKPNGLFLTTVGNRGRGGSKKTSMRLWLNLSALLALLHITHLDAGRAVSKKSLGKLEKGLLSDDIGVTGDQFQGLKHTAKCGGKMVLSFLSGRKERKAAKRLLKKHLPHAKIKKFSTDGSKCLEIKVKAERTEGDEGGEGDGDEMEDKGGDQGGQMDSAPPKNVEVGGGKKAGAGKGDRVKDDGRIPDDAGQAGGHHTPTGEENKHRLYLKALLKKIRQSNELEVKQVEVRMPPAMRSLCLSLFPSKMPCVKIFTNHSVR